MKPTVLMLLFLKNRREGMAADEVEVGENGDCGCLSYKELYHASVERSWNLQEQLKKYSGLLSKHQRITELKVASWYQNNPCTLNVVLGLHHF